ncbi:hypothetical protein PLESTM_000628600 [Pleodorina starrii]|nr:hypothetical protein PLESTM_000628600 [Pleodorina starrii]
MQLTELTDGLVSRESLIASTCGVVEQQLGRAVGAYTVSLEAAAAPLHRLLASAGRLEAVLAVEEAQAAKHRRAKATGHGNAEQDAGCATGGSYASASDAAAAEGGSAAAAAAVGTAAAGTTKMSYTVVRQVSELLAAGEWARCEELLERELRLRQATQADGVAAAALAAAPPPPPAPPAGSDSRVDHSAAAVEPGPHQSVEPLGRPGPSGCGSRSGQSRSTSAPLQPGGQRGGVDKVLLQALLATKIHLEMSYSSYSAGSATGTVAVATAAAATAAASSGVQGRASAAAAGAILRWAAAWLGGGSGGSERTCTAGAASAAGASTCSPPLSGGEVRRWFRRLAALVHPDKCRTSGVVPEHVAVSAFRLLQEGCDALVDELTEASAAAAGARKRARGAWRSGGGTEYDDAEWGVGGGKEENDGDDEAVWWAEWRSCPPSPPPSYCGGGTAAAAAGIPPTSCPSEGDDEPRLWTLGLEELRSEVALRQSQVLRPPPGSEAAALPPHSRQRRLRVARSVLAERTRAAAVTASDGGGFVPSTLAERTGATAATAAAAAAGASDGGFMVGGRGGAGGGGSGGVDAGNCGCEPGAGGFVRL